ncbi:MAG: hypothetical protein HQM09_23235 [Candidatus Riflebacteria bacterium]|nr:hypothetical protein [Candidatus Riflebacteria bacterium]
MKILHVFIRDLGGEFADGKLLEAARSLGELMPERTANLYSDYFTMSGLSPVRTLMRREEVLIAGVSATLSVFVKLYNYGVILLEYAIELKVDFDLPGQLFKERSIELAGGRHIDLEALRKGDLDAAMRRLAPWLEKSYDVPDFFDRFHVFVDSKTRPEEEAMKILLPGDESYSESTKRHIAKHIELWEEGEHFYLMGNRAYLSTALDSSDITNFLELSRVQLYELKVYDFMLDKSIEGTYKFLDKLPRQDEIFPLAWLRKDFKNQIRHVFRLTEIRMDLVDLIKDITNTSKVTEDPYFAGVYRELNETFNISEWFQSVRGKVDELEDIQRMILSRIDIFKSTTLEMTVIILILIEIVIPVAELLHKFFR